MLKSGQELELTTDYEFLGDETKVRFGVKFFFPPSPSVRTSQPGVGNTYFSCGGHGGETAFVMLVGTSQETIKVVNKRKEHNSPSGVNGGDSYCKTVCSGVDI